MAVTFNAFAPFDSGPGSAIGEPLWRKVMQHNRMDGVISTATWPKAPTELQVFADGSSLTLEIYSGQCWIGGVWGKLNAIRTVSISTPDDSFSRIDLVVARADFDINKVVLDVLTGSPGSGTPPPLTKSSSRREIALAEVTVPANATAIAQEDVADRRLRVGRAQYSHWTPPLYYEGNGSLSNPEGVVARGVTASGTPAGAYCRYTQKDKVVHFRYGFGWVNSDELGWYGGTGPIFTLLPPGMVSAVTGEHRLVAHLWTRNRDDKGDTSLPFVHRDWLGSARIAPDSRYVLPYFTRDEDFTEVENYRIEATEALFPVPNVNPNSGGGGGGTGAFPEGGYLIIEGEVEIQ